MKTLTTLVVLNLSISMFGQCFDKVSGGVSHTAAIKSDGVIFTWGDNNFGQLGDGSMIDKHVPTQIVLGIWQEVTAGERNSLAIKADGTLWAWGWSTGGGPAASFAPVQVGTATDWEKVVTSAKNMGHTMAIKTNGTLWAWGRNDYGQLGDGSITNRTAPVQIGTATNWQSVALGAVHTVAIRTDGTLWVWGWNSNGTFGNGTTSGSQYTPIQVGTDQDWQSVTAGINYNLVIKNNGTLWVSGYNQYDQASSLNLYINQVGSDNNWQSVVAGQQHNVALKTDGTLWAWGYNNHGQLGDGTTVHKSVPTQIGIDTDWQLISAGLFHTAAIKNDGSLYTWGYNNNGQVGDNSTINKNEPVAIACPPTSPVLSNADFTKANSIKVYPNPVKDFLNFSSDREKVTVSVCDVMGREVLLKSLNPTESKIDVSQLSSGTYFVKITAGQLGQTVTVIKE